MRRILFLLVLAPAAPALATFPLALQFAGQGTGKIFAPLSVCTPPSCTQAIGENHPVTLKAASGSSEFLGWELGTGPAATCNGTKTDCAFTMSGAASLTARFGPGIAMTMAKLGPDDGAVVNQDSGSGTFSLEISCPPDCQGTFPPNSVVRVGPSAPSIAQPGKTFTGWSGGSGSAAVCTGSTPCTFTITQPSSLFFEFKQSTVNIHVAFAGSGSGTVTWPPASPCQLSAAAPNCNRTSLPNSQSTVGVTPAANTRFKRWIDGPCANQTAQTCTVTPVSSISMKAELERTDITAVPSTLTIGTLGNSDGKIFATALTQGVPPNNINCRRDDKQTVGSCTASFPTGTSLRLEATPTKDLITTPDPEFKGWFEGTGGAAVCNGKTTLTCTFTLSGNSTVKAKFCRKVLGCLAN